MPRLLLNRTFSVNKVERPLTRMLRMPRWSIESPWINAGKPKIFHLLISPKCNSRSESNVEMIQSMVVIITMLNTLYLHMSKSFLVKAESHLMYRIL